jgi:DNA-binding winged helix-turn-helix (wHTH) protein
MVAKVRSARFLRFGVYEADLQERDLYKSGLKVKLQEQPFEVLVALLERPDETVTSEELSRRIWPEGTYVDFEHSLYTAILKIRRVLGDSAENPRL